MDIRCLYTNMSGTLFFFSEWLKAVAVYYFGRLDEPSKEPRFSNFNVAGNSEKN